MNLIFLHVGADRLVTEKEIVGIFDLDQTTVARASRDFIRQAEQQKRTVIVSYELPKSFVLCAPQMKKGAGKRQHSKKNQQDTVYISQISSMTLKKRMEEDF